MDRFAVFLVDDEPDFLFVCRTLLDNAGLSVVGAEPDPLRALEGWRSLDSRPDIVVTDYFMPAMTGLELGARMLAEVPDQCVVLLTIEQVGRRLRHSAADAGFATVLTKDHPSQLPESLRRCYQQHATRSSQR